MTLAVFAVAVVVFSHRNNIARLIAHAEPKFEFQKKRRPQAGRRQISISEREAGDCAAYPSTPPTATPEEILRDIGLSVSERFVAITAPTGGGKSTLARVIAGIMLPSAGQVLLDREDITALGVTERARRGIGFAFQQPVRFKGLTVYDLLRMASGRKLTVSEACDYLARVGMCARDYVNPRGQRQPVRRRAEAHRDRHRPGGAPSCPIFDEPEAGITTCGAGT